MRTDIVLAPYKRKCLRPTRGPICQDILQDGYIHIHSTRFIRTGDNDHHVISNRHLQQNDPRYPRTLAKRPYGFDSQSLYHGRQKAILSV